MRTNLSNRDVVVEAVRQAVEANGGKRVALREFLAGAEVEKKEVFRHFARWEEALAAAGCEFEPRNEPIEPGRLLADWGAVARELRRTPTRAEYRVRGKYAVGTVERRFGGWGKVRESFRDFAKKKREWREALAAIDKEGRRAERNAAVGDAQQEEWG